MPRGGSRCFDSRALVMVRQAGAVGMQRGHATAMNYTVEQLLSLYIPFFNGKDNILLGACRSERFFQAFLLKSV